jgi:hypothetical protein
MRKLLKLVVPFLLSLPILAAAQEEGGAASAPVHTVDMVYVVIFLALFIGAIAGFLVYFFLQSDKKKEKPVSR